jgi:acyl-CoA thioesterase-2
MQTGHGSNLPRLGCIQRLYPRKSKIIIVGAGLEELLSLVRLDVEPSAEIARFEASAGSPTFYGTLFGGQLLGQAVAAALASAPGRVMHSLHAYFLAAGRPHKPVRYRVESIRDGRSFAHRRVTAYQDEDLLTMTCVLQQGSQESFSHQRPMPKVPPAEDLVDIKVLARGIDPELPSRIVGHFAGDNPIDLRPIDGALALEQQGRAPWRAWIRIPSLAGCDSEETHQAALAWLSDFWISSAALIPHRAPLPGPDIRLASIDHALWFHGPVTTSDWLLYDADSPAAGQGTGLTRGSLFDRRGKLVASVTQDILQRLST